MLEINNQNFETEVLKSELPVLVDFWAPWCGPCRAQAPVLDKLALDCADKIKVAKLNVDEEPALAMAFRVESIPTMILFKNGELSDKLIGLHSLDQLKAKLGL